MKALIDSTDVNNVARRINVVLTRDQMRKVLNMFEGESENDPTARWDLIVENCIYSVI